MAKVMMVGGIDAECVAEFADALRRVLRQHGYRSQSRRRSTSAKPADE